jgi:hypothetical protein
MDESFSLPSQIRARQYQSTCSQRAHPGSLPVSAQVPRSSSMRRFSTPFAIASEFEHHVRDLARGGVATPCCVCGTLPEAVSQLRVACAHVRVRHRGGCRGVNRVGATIPDAHLG